MVKVAVVVGHNTRERGAFALAPISEHEFTFNTRIADRMVEMTAASSLELKKFHRRYVGSYTREIEEVYGQVEDWGAETSIELHFNSYTPSSHGTETLSSGSTKSRLLATAIQESMVETLNLRDRGVKFRSREERGGKSLHAASPPAILVEPFFGSNQADVNRAAELTTDDFSEMYLKGLRRYLNIAEPDIDPPDGLSSEEAFLVNVSFLTQNLTKFEFFSQNREAIKAIIDAVNQESYQDSHGEEISELSILEVIGVMNAEMGLKDGKVDATFEHSNGERGLLPLPSNIKYWNGPTSPAANVLVSVERNVKEFILYLGNLKNRDVGRTFSNGTLYRDLFSIESYDGLPRAQMFLLAAAIHGWFLPSNFTANAIPYRLLADTVIKAETEPESVVSMLSELGYIHARTEAGRTLIRNRLMNLINGIEIVSSLGIA